MPTLTIQPATSSQCDLLAQLHSACFPRGWSSAEFASFFERDGIVAAIAYDNDHPIGFIFCWIVVDQCELLAIATLPDWRGQGIARQLLNHAIAQATTKQAGAIHLEVSVNNPAALALYRTSGFNIISRRKAYYRLPDGTTEDAITMRCDL